MRYKVGDKVMVRWDLEVDEQYGSEVFTNSMKKFTGKIYEIGEEKFEAYWMKEIMQKEYQNFYFSDEMLRPAEFKIWCETKEEKQAVLEELEKEGYVWYNSKKKPTEKDLLTPVGILVWKTDFENNPTITYTKSIRNFDKEEYCQFTPSEFTGINFSEKIVIAKTPTGATATYGDKTVTAEGDFEDAARQALAELLCPFKVGDKVRDRRCKNKGIVTKIRISGEVVVHLDDESGDYDMTFKTLELLEPYVEPSYNAKLFCIEGHGVFKQGVVYTVENGIFIGVHDSHFKDLEDINKNLVSQFMEIKGGLDD